MASTLMRTSPNRRGSESIVLEMPALIAELGDTASERFVEFFTANISNSNTRAAYSRAIATFFHWCQSHRVRDLQGIRPLHVAAYLKAMEETRATSSVKQSLAAIRMLFDWLVVGQVLPINPAHAVRGPKQIIDKGKTPILSAEEARQLFASIDTSHLVGLRDRAVIATMLYTFARVEAVVGINVDDYFAQGRRGWIRLHEKGGKLHDMPAHHKLEEFLDAYIGATGGENAFPQERSSTVGEATGGAEEAIQTPLGEIAGSLGAAIAAKFAVRAAEGAFNSLLIKRFGRRVVSAIRPIKMAA